MVLELKVPHSAGLAAPLQLWPVFLSYVLSFVFLGIYWNNHHHVLNAVRCISGRNLWANLHLLFWLSLIPFATGWMGENHFATGPVALYGMVLLCAACAYLLLQRSLIKAEGPDCPLARAGGGDWKGNLSPLTYAAAIPLRICPPTDLLRALHRGGVNLAPPRPADRAKNRVGGAAAGCRPLTNIARRHGIFCNLACARADR
jgi:uncharacterized membrane protein